MYNELDEKIDGGLSPKKRREVNRKTGSNLRDGVRKAVADMTPQDMRRKGSWATRHFCGKAAPASDSKLYDKKTGEYTAKSKQARRWGEPAPKTVSAARRICKMGRALLRKYHKRINEDKQLPIDLFNTVETILNNFENGTIDHKKALQQLDNVYDRNVILREKIKKYYEEKLNAGHCFYETAQKICSQIEKTNDCSNCADEIFEELCEVAQNLCEKSFIDQYKDHLDGMSIDFMTMAPKLTQSQLLSNTRNAVKQYSQLTRKNASQVERDLNQTFLRKYGQPLINFSKDAPKNAK